MFDFFAEIIEFLNQFVFNTNYIAGLIDNIVASGSESVSFIGKLSLLFPASFRWIPPAALVAMIVDFIRGR